MIIRKEDVKLMIVISACLLGLNCRYDGGSALFQGALDLMRMGLGLPICPEQLGGLPTPRLPCEIRGDRVFNIEELDVTDLFQKGVKESMALVRMSKIEGALLKEKSPSCGVSWVYDGSFSGSLRRGQGLFASALVAEGVSVFSVEDFCATKPRVFLDKVGKRDFAYGTEGKRGDFVF